MMEVMVTVRFKDRNYNTNVLVHKGMTDEEIKRLAEEQVIRQWNL
ncbi:BA3454 family stress response protein [Neobacillus muris]|nr:BA3454 family stress response protein [Neobacillus muris]